MFERAVAVSCLPERLGRRVLQCELGLQRGGRRHLARRRAPVDPRGHAVVRQLRRVAHDRAIDVARPHGAVRRHDELDHDAQVVLRFEKRRRAVESASGSIGKFRTPRVDRRRVTRRVLVDRRALGDERVDVGDRHLDRVAPSGRRSATSS